MKGNKLQKTKDFIIKLEKSKKISLNKPLLDYLDDNFLNELIDKKPDFNDYFDKITRKFYKNHIFDVTFTTYEEAINFLSKNDPSLKKSISIYGYDCEGRFINSIHLAEALKGFMENEKIESSKDEINNFFIGLCEK